jgi:antitoxin component YwqK of YwqJK toxin-antitoxin module
MKKIFIFILIVLSDYITLLAQAGGGSTPTISAPTPTKISTINRNAPASKSTTVRVSELQQNGQQFLLNSIPYTGRVVDYEGDILNGEMLRYEAFYLNGLANGKARRWFSANHLQSEENYVNGIKEGMQILFYENGQKKEEANYINGRIHGISTSYHDNGKIKKQVSFQNGIQADTLIKQFDKNGKVELEEIFRENGTVKINRKYFIDKISEESFENNILSYEGIYNSEFIKNGQWKYYKIYGNSKSAKISKIENYENGKLEGISEEYDEDGSVSSRSFYKNGVPDLFALHSVKYHTANGSQILVGCPDMVNHSLVIVRITKPSTIYNSYFKSSNGSSTYATNSNEEKLLSLFMSNLIGHRGIFEITDYQMKQFENDTIFYDLSITTPQLDFGSENVKFTNGSIGTGYCCTVSMYAVLTDINNAFAGKFSYSSSTCPRGGTSWGGSSQFFANKDEAFNGAINGSGTFTQAHAFSGQVLRFVYNTFQVCNMITSIDERDGDNLVKRLTCKTVSFSDLPDNLHFTVYRANDLVNNQSPMGTLKIKEVNANGIKLKVDEGAERITSAFDKSEKLYVLSDLYK